MRHVLGVGALVLIACGGPKSRGERVSGATTEPKDDRQALCPAALDASGLLDGFAHEIARGCPLPVFVTNDPVCGRTGQCPRPCETYLFMGDQVMGPISFEYDASGNMIGARGGRMLTTCTFDGARIVKCDSEDGRSVTVKRDASQRILSATDGTQTYTFTYNTHGDLATVVRPGMYADDPQMSWTIAYDDKHRLATETEASGKVVRYRYDERGRMIERDEKGGRSPYSETFRYDDADRLIASSSTRQFETTFTYDAQGRITEYSAVNPQNAGATGARYSYQCGAAASPPPSNGNTQTGTAPVAGCVVDAANEKACAAKGAGFSYGPAPFIYCSGVAADTAALSKQHAKAQQSQPCVCNNQQAIQQQVAHCSRVPSAPRR